MKKLTALITALALLLASTPVSAELTPEEDVETMRSQMHAYFDADQNAALLFIIIGAATFAGGLTMLVLEDDMLQAMGIPVAAVGGIQLAVGSTVYFRTSGQVEELDATLDSAPRTYVETELPRMRDVRFWYDVYMVLESVLLVAGAGVATVGFLEDNDFAKGFGIGLAAQSGVMLGLDLFAQSRADTYTAQIVDFARKLNMPVDEEGATPITLQWRMTF